MCIEHDIDKGELLLLLLPHLVTILLPNPNSACDISLRKLGDWVRCWKGKVVLGGTMQS